MLQERLVKWFLRPSPTRGQSSGSLLPVALATDVGLKRDSNQDRVAAIRINAGGASAPFLAVALVDGMGGMRDGEKCAALAISAFFFSLVKQRGIPVRERLHSAAQHANEVVYEFSAGRGGATLSSVLFSKNDSAHLVNIGDSRVYSTFARNNDPDLVRLTRDDSLEEAVGGHGRELLQYVGMGTSLKPHVEKLPASTDKIFLTTDGVHFVSQEVMSFVAFYSSDFRQATERLTTLSQWCGGHDNASIAVTSVSEISRFLNEEFDSGVEIWDPFGALQILWTKDSAGEALERVAIESPQDKMESTASAPLAETPRVLSKGKTKKKEADSRRKKSSRQGKLVQLEIEVSDASGRKVGNK